MVVQDTPWYGGPARMSYLLIWWSSMISLLMKISKDSSLRSSSGWMQGRKLRFIRRFFY
ncbi:hypothetical protein NC651_004238 [Populus alba x Populus x berolinensis]|nr:hypothetical protein NC651_004238 [Populus alba x Populus x berolinensis]